jgi:GTP cyclohydrolase II
LPALQERTQGILQTAAQHWFAASMRANAAGARRLPDFAISFLIVCTRTCESRIEDIRSAALRIAAFSRL